MVNSLRYSNIEKRSSDEEIPKSWKKFSPLDIRLLEEIRAVGSRPTKQTRNLVTVHRLDIGKQRGGDLVIIRSGWLNEVYSMILGSGGPIMEPPANLGERDSNNYRDAILAIGDAGGLYLAPGHINSVKVMGTPNTGPVGRPDDGAGAQSGSIMMKFRPPPDNKVDEFKRYAKIALSSIIRDEKIPGIIINKFSDTDPARGRFETQDDYIEKVNGVLSKTSGEIIDIRENTWSEILDVIEIIERKEGGAFGPRGKYNEGKRYIIDMIDYIMIHLAKEEEWLEGEFKELISGKYSDNKYVGSVVNLFTKLGIAIEEKNGTICTMSVNKLKELGDEINATKHVATEQLAEQIVKHDETVKLLNDEIDELRLKLDDCVTLDEASAELEAANNICKEDAAGELFTIKSYGIAVIFCMLVIIIMLLYSIFAQ